MAILAAIPDKSNNSVQIGMPNSFKIVPRNLDGTVKDCTGFDSFSSLHLIVGSGVGQGRPLSATVTPVGDATGITISISNTNLTNLYTGSLGATSYQAYIDASDGTDSFLAWQGVLQIAGNTATLGQAAFG